MLGFEDKKGRKLKCGKLDTGKTGKIRHLVENIHLALSW